MRMLQRYLLPQLVRRPFSSIKTKVPAGTRLFSNVARDSFDQKDKLQTNPVKKVQVISPTATFQTSYQRPTSVTENKHDLTIHWSTGKSSTFSYVWLRDSCHCTACYHPHAQERIHDTSTIPLNARPKSIKIISMPSEHPDDESIEILWNYSDVDGKPHVSTFSKAFLLENANKNNCFNSFESLNQNMDEHLSISLWDVNSITDCIPRVEYSNLVNGDQESLRIWLEGINRFGFSIVEGVPRQYGFVEKVASLISFTKRTFWGDLWSVKSVRKPTNLSLTSHELYPHTDFSWSETPPGLQFLHCLEFRGETKSPQGGESTLVDGFFVANFLRENHPQIFDLLSKIPIKHSFYSKDHCFEYSEPVFKRNNLGEIERVRFNQANRSPLQIQTDLVIPYYEALQMFTNIIRSDKNLLKFRLNEGDLLVFNNHRMLHGRKSYDSACVTRHFEGLYLDYDAYRSRLTMLHQSRKRHSETTPRQSLNSRNKIMMQSRMHSTSTHSRSHDPGFQNFNEKFVTDALKPWNNIIEEGKLFEDGSSLQSVADFGSVKFTSMKDGTKADYIYQCALFTKDFEVNLVNRLIGMLEKLEGDHIALGTGAQVDLFEHSLQSASRAYNDNQSDEMIVCALLHDIGEFMCPINHGDIAAALLRPYIDPELHWMLSHHEIFQGYYYFHHTGGDRDTRDLFKHHPQFDLTKDFCELYDQPSFDPNYDTYPIDFFKPFLKQVLSRKPYWFQPNHPKLGVVTIQDE